LKTNTLKNIAANKAGVANLEAAGLAPEVVGLAPGSQWPQNLFRQFI
jgi:hypothetical protein